MSRVSEFLANQQLTLSLSIQNNAKDRAYTRCLNTHFGHRRTKPPKKHTTLLFILFGVLILTFGEGVVNYIVSLIGGLV